MDNMCTPYPAVQTRDIFRIVTTRNGRDRKRQNDLRVHAVWYSKDTRDSQKLNSTARTTPRVRGVRQPLRVTVHLGYTNSLPEQNSTSVSAATTKNEVDRNSTVRHATVPTCSAHQAGSLISSARFHKHAPSARTRSISGQICRPEFLSGAEALRDQSWNIDCTRFIRQAHKVSCLTEHLHRASCLVPKHSSCHET